MSLFKNNKLKIKKILLRKNKRKRKRKVLITEVSMKVKLIRMINLKINKL
jgi:hypothetical protein